MIKWFDLFNFIIPHKNMPQNSTVYSKTEQFYIDLT